MLRIAAVTSAIALLVALVFPASGQSGIIVDNADGLLTLNFSSSTDLNNLLSGIQARVAVQYSNNLRNFTLSDLPTPFKDLLDGVTQRVVVGYANSTRSMALVTPPTGLHDLLTGIPARVMFQYANNNLQASLVYPRELINDKVAPVSSDFELIVESNKVHLKWTTNEFARCNLRYGTQPGNYTQGQLAVANQIGAKKKEWLATLNPARYAHHWTAK